MNVHPWLLAGFAVLSGVYALVFVYVYYRGEVSRPVASGERSGSVTEDVASEGTVQCRQCGTDNGSEYRFCRECTAELPGSVVSVSGGRTPQSRFLR